MFLSYNSDSKRKGRNVSFGSTGITNTKTFTENSTNSHYLNEGLRQIKDIQNCSRNIKQIVSSIKKRKKICLGSLHKSCLKETFDNKFFLTSTQILKNEEFDYKKNLLTNDGSFSNRIFSYNSNKVFPNTTERESLKIFIDKTLEISKNKFLLESKKENVLRLNEDYYNQLGEKRENIRFFKNTSNLLENEYESIINKYLKFILIQKEKEKQVLEKITQIKNQIETDIHRLTCAITSNKKEYEKSLEYKNFMICLKNGILKLPYTFSNLMKIGNLNFEKNKRNSVPDNSKNNHHLIEKRISVVNYSSHLNLKSNYKNESECHNKKRSIKKKGAILFDNETKDYFRYLTIMSPYDIFSCIQDFIKKLKEFENENLNLIEKYNQTSEKLFKINNEYKISLNEDKIIENNLLNNITVKNRILLNLKEKNKILIEEKNKRLLNDKNSKRSDKLENQKFNCKMLGRTDKKFDKEDFNNFEKLNIKINRLYKLLCDEFLNFDSDIHEDFLSKEGELNLLKIKLCKIEKIIYFLVKEFNVLKSSKSTKLNEIVSNVEKEKKDKNLKDFKQIEKNKIKKLILKLKENEKIKHFSNKRKTVKRFKPLDKKPNIISYNFIKESNHEEEIQKLISYDDDIDDLNYINDNK